MGYTIRRWLSSSGMLFDDSESVKTADDAIQTAKKLSGICKSFINEDIEARIRSMEPGEKNYNPKTIVKIYDPHQKEEVMKIPAEWLSGKTILTADKVKKLDPGTEIWIHQCYGRRGEHMFVKATVAQSGKKKVLKCRDWRGLPVIKEIRTAENIAYTAD